ncbi:hypothetical protein EPN90_02895 [Patescibacteria group bacterium]|nr:MAG: hypothetical protein EPN90_02895 [Patescibacteria group bacterium]
MRVWSLIALVLIGIVTPPASLFAFSPRTLIKTSASPTIYFLAEDGKRYVFPNYGTFQSWYPAGSKDLTVLSSGEIAAIPLGGNVTYRPGARLLKITTDPKVYAVAKNGVLRWVTTETLAAKLYGPAWNTLVSDVPDAFFTDYTPGDPVTSPELYDAKAQMVAVPTVQENLKIVPAPSPIPTQSTLPPANQLSCPKAKTLESLITCAMQQFGPFIPPTALEQTDFRAMVRSLLNGGCAAIPLPARLANIYSLRIFTDSENSQTYCVLMDTQDANNDFKTDHGWGVFIVNQSPQRELNIAITHPVDDWQTEEQGIGVFKGTESRTFFMAGATRGIGAPSTCQPDSAHSSSDAAHNTASMSSAATQELNDWYGGRLWQQLQFHGMAATTCPGVGVYITNGLKTAPASGSSILALKTNLLKRHPDWSVKVPGDTPSCSLNATTNVQGRYLNGVAAGKECGQPASSNSQKFFSIEQAPGFRQAKDWIAAIEDTWPVAGAPSKTSGSGGGGALQSTYFTSYGYNDNDDGQGHFGTAAIAYPDSFHPVATEGLGTYTDPITFATDQREIPVHTIIYVPFLQKYFRMDDACGACTNDWNNGQKWRTDLFMGGNSALQPEPALANCEAYITRKDIMYINAGPGYTVDTTPLFSNGVCTARLH